MPSIPGILARKYLILVEGASDEAFLDALIRQYSIPDFQVIPPRSVAPNLGGASAFTRVLQSLPIREGFSGVAGILIVSDNDNDPAVSFENVSRAIDNAEPFDDPPRRFVAPARPEVKSESHPPIVVFMLPEYGKPGNLESLCIEAARSTMPRQIQCVDELVECAGIGTWPLPMRDKAKVRSLVAVAHEQRPDIALPSVWQDIPQLFDVGAPAFRQIVSFLMQFPKML